MRLKQLRLENFRCYEHLELDLHPRLTVLVGENGAGKTAILDALAVGLSPVMRYLSSANQRLYGGVGLKDTDIRLECCGVQGTQRRWSASDFSRISIQTTESLSWDVWKGAAKGKSPASKLGEAELAQGMEKVLESLKTSQPELLPIFSYYGAQRGAIEIPQRLHSKEKNYGYPVSALLGALNAGSDFREMLQWFDSEESTELRSNKGRRPEEYEDSIALSAVRVAIGKVLGNQYYNPHFNREHKFVIEAEEGPSPIYISQLSQGYKSMLALAMDFSRRLAIGNGHLSMANAMEPTDQEQQILEAFDTLNPQWANELLDTDTRIFEALPLLSPGIMLIDEIDMHLHPSWQQRVLDDLMRAFPLTQFIVTTHSPQVLSTIRRENIRVLQTQPDGTTTAEMPSFSPLAHESGDALAQIMFTHREPELPLQEDVRVFEQLVRAGEEESSEAQAIRARLEDAGYQFHASDLSTWRFLAEHKNKMED